MKHTVIERKTYMLRDYAYRKAVELITTFAHLGPPNSLGRYSETDEP